jgi:hypothetical protein
MIATAGPATGGEMRVRAWSARHLFASWLVYWAVLLAVVAGRPLWRYWQLQRGDSHGTVSLTYAGSMSAVALWIAGPPLILFLVWLATRSRARAENHMKGPVA